MASGTNDYERLGTCETNRKLQLNSGEFTFIFEDVFVKVFVDLVWWHGFIYGNDKEQAC